MNTVAEKSAIKTITTHYIDEAGYLADRLARLGVEDELVIYGDLIHVRSRLTGVRVMRMRAAPVSISSR